MSKIAILLPQEYMLAQAQKIIEDEQLDIDFLKVIQTADAVFEARNAVENGAGIIVARGLQASFIKTYTNIPVAEIVMTGQEMARLIRKAKDVLNKEKPCIAIIGFENMFCDMSYFEEIFDITLKIFFLKALDGTAEAIREALLAGADLLIGGEVLQGLAGQQGVPSLYIESTGDSIRNALDVAYRMKYTAESEKSQAAQFETVLDTAANGVIKVNRNMEITNINRRVEKLLNKKADQVIGRKLPEIVPELEENYLTAILAGKRDTLSTTVRICNTSVMVTVTPIQYEDYISGAILTCHHMESPEGMDASKYRQMFLSGYLARHQFGDLKPTSPGMKECISTAKIYALSSKPVLIYGETGTEKEVLAQCIHNNSVYKNGPFISVNVSGMDEQMQMDRLFGNPGSSDESIQKGALAIGNLGTVMISEVDRLSPVCQYRLYRAIQYESLIQNDLERSQTLENRLIITALRNLAVCVNEGTFRKDLYYLLNGLVINIPPLRERPEDIEETINQCRKAFNKKYSKYLTISDEAMDLLKAYSWNGNSVQLDSFCERMFLMTPKKIIREDYVQFLLDDLYPVVDTSGQETKMVVYKHPEAARITELLDKYRGNRAAAAKELGVSTTTLWRHMKKYGINDK